MGLFGIIWKVVAILILAVIGLGAYLYFTDYEASATVVARSEDPNDPWVEIQPDLPLLSAYTYRTSVSKEAWAVVCTGYEVKFHIKSQDYTVFNATGELVYNSVTGQINQTAALTCAASNVGPGGITIPTPRA